VAIPLGKLGSLWLDTVDRPSWPPLEGDVRVDVAVLGAGITGLTAGLLLAREGLQVAVLEARWIGAGATGYTTAKLSSLHGLTYSSLASRHGDDVAWLYGEMNESGIASIAGLVEDLDIDCDLRVKPNFTYAESQKDARKVAGEVEVAQRLGLPASFVESCDLPFPIAGAVRFDNQAEFHPGKYLVGLAQALTRAGGRLFERTRATGVSDGAPCAVSTDGGHTVAAEHVIVATHIPFLDRGFYFARTHPERSYVVAAPLRARGPSAMYLSTESPAHSIRVHELDDGRRFLLVGGESHKTGQADARDRYARLAGYARERFGVDVIAYHWATQDNMPIDGLPYVGKVHPLARGVLVATGYKKWGLALGTAAAELLADLVVDRDNPYVRLVDPARVRVRASVPTYVKENVNVGYHFVADRLLRRGAGAEQLEPGEGKVVGTGVGQRAVYRDDDGQLHTMSARCSHLGCIVSWNAAERTWDCPCHGSRFAADGEVIQGPAVSPLAREE
jgi:glycine/D-amino acid oxidase-like deaminating enzyme/nitrite reductase/ring-hydroxylating ferredoxin subunit